MTRYNSLDLGSDSSAFRQSTDLTQSPEERVRSLVTKLSFPEDNGEISNRVAQLVPRVAAETVAAIAIEARSKIELRHAALLLVREMARHETHRRLVAETLDRVIQRADDLVEFVAIYWKNGREPLSAQVKRGLAAAFPRFDERELANSDRGGQVKLRDVLFLSHAKPRDAAQASIWRKLIWGRLGRDESRRS
jgi:60 kDa SS-A/Ro ribonucleoprotein